MTTSAPQARAALIAGLADTRERLRVAARALDAGEVPDGATAIHRVLSAEAADAAEAYREWLPRPIVSRCPLSGSLVRHSIDTEGLDGPWWNYDAPVRPLESLPPTLFALRGAVRLAPDVESTPFLAMPGPEAPYVLRSLLAHEEMVAVVTSMRLGRHRAFPIAYFARAAPHARRPNDWGAGRFAVAGLTGPVWLDGDEPGAADMDFDLRPWIANGKLLWIAPDDPQARLRSDTEACPYLGLLGGRAMVRVQGTRQWTDAEAGGRR